MAIGFNKSFNVQRLVKKLLWTIMALFIGGITLTYYIRAMNGTCSPFYSGLSFIGVSVGNATCTTTGVADVNTITSPTISTSVLSVVGVMAIGGIIMSEFLTW